MRILLADDHALVREGVATLINRQDDMQVCWQAENGEEAVHLFRRHHPCLAVMDVRMPVMDGIQATQHICTEFPAALVVAFTSSADEDGERMLNAGAKVCLPKDGPASDLLAAIRHVHATAQDAP